VKKYLLSIWCRDCCGEDFQGCFDGGAENSEYDTLIEAKDVADNALKIGVPWEYKILEQLPEDKFKLIEQTSVLLDGKELVE